MLNGLLKKPPLAEESCPFPFNQDLLEKNECPEAFTKVDGFHSLQMPFLSERSVEGFVRQCVVSVFAAGISPLLLPPLF